MKRFWTADIHMGHANICIYASRPWLRKGYADFSGHFVSDDARKECAERMNKGLIANINSRVKPNDVVVHVGDFCCKGRERGVEGTKTKAEEWLSMLNGRWVMIEGNHDDNNGLRFGIQAAVVKIGTYTAFVQHRPIEWMSELPDFCDFVVCGHVHNLWKEKKIAGVWNINVGVDARRFLPISDSELIEIYCRLKRTEHADTKTTGLAV